MNRVELEYRALAFGPTPACHPTSVEIRRDAEEREAEGRRDAENAERIARMQIEAAEKVTKQPAPDRTSISMGRWPCSIGRADRCWDCC
jgi:hypothetical protein